MMNVRMPKARRWWPLYVYGAQIFLCVLLTSIPVEVQQVIPGIRAAAFRKSTGSWFPVLGILAVFTGYNLCLDTTGKWVEVSSGHDLVFDTGVGRLEVQRRADGARALVDPIGGGIVIIEDVDRM